MQENQSIPKVNPFCKIYQNLNLVGYIEKKKEESGEPLVNGKETVNFYTPHQFEYMVVTIANGVREGYAALYEDGMKKMEWEFSNGKRKGMFTVYKYGLREFSGWWNEDGVWDSRYYVEYTPCASILVQCHPTTGIIIYRGGMGKNYRIREGWGVTYDSVTGLPDQYGFFIDNHLVRVYQRFGANHTMYEYSFDDDESVLNVDVKLACKTIMEHGEARRRCLYSGGYIQKDGLFYVRHGEGCEKEGSHIFNGVWEQGIVKERTEVIDGYRSNKLVFNCFENIRGRSNDVKSESEMDSCKREGTKPTESVKQSVGSFFRRTGEEFVKEEFVKEKPTREEFIKEKPTREEFVKEKPTREEFVKEKPVKEDFSKKTEDYRKIEETEKPLENFRKKTEELKNPIEDFRRPNGQAFLPKSSNPPRSVNFDKKPSRGMYPDHQEVEYETVSEDTVKAMLSRLEKVREENIENMPSLYADESEESSEEPTEPLPIMKPTVTEREELFHHNVVEEEKYEEDGNHPRWKETPQRDKPMKKQVLEETSESEDSDAELTEEKKEQLSNLFDNLLKDTKEQSQETKPESLDRRSQGSVHSESANKQSQEGLDQDTIPITGNDSNLETDVIDLKPPVLSRRVESEPSSSKDLTSEQKSELDKLLSAALPENANKQDSYIMEEDTESDSDPDHPDIEALIRKKVQERNQMSSRQRVTPVKEQPKQAQGTAWPTTSAPFIPKQSVTETSWKPRTISQDPTQWLSAKAQAHNTFGVTRSQEENFAIKTVKSRNQVNTGTLEVVVTTTVDYQEMSTSVTHLIIADGSCNDDVLWRFDVSDCSNLMELTIGKNCFRNVDDVRLCDMRFLEKIAVGDNTFLIDDNTKEYRRFSISGINKLYKIAIGECVAEDYYEFELRDCPMLRQVVIGSHSFKKMHTCRIENLMSLKEIIIGDETFQGDGDVSKRGSSTPPYNYSNCLILKDLPDLTTLRNQKGSSFNYFGYITMRNLPKIAPRGIELNENNIHFKYAFSFDIKKAITMAKYFQKYCPYYN